MQEIVYQEEPDYSLHAFIADIGGATGVILGISFATLFGALDFALAHLSVIVQKFIKARNNFHAMPSSASQTDNMLYI
mgnify:CR=1 FL=1